MDAQGSVPPTLVRTSPTTEESLQDDLSEHPEESLQDDLLEPLQDDLLEHPEELLQDDLLERPKEPLQDDLPERPEEPLQGDCCGTGCSPCVFDIYREELERWEELAHLTPQERAAARLQQGLGGGGGARGRKGVSSFPPSPAALSPREYRSFEVVEIERVSCDSCVYTFQLPEECVLGVDLGQHAVLRVNDVTRQYTPISDPRKIGSFDVLIKVYPNGRMSEHVRGWRVGSKADWRGPFGSFTYKPNKFRHIGLLACGTGIAPMVNIIRAITENEEEETTLHCLYTCRTQHHLLLKRSLLQSFASFWNFTITYALSRSSPEAVSESPGELGYGDKVHHGRVDFDLVQREMAPRLSLSGGNDSNSSNNVVLICGTKSFTKDMINILRKLGCGKESYFKF